MVNKFFFTKKRANLFVLFSLNIVILVYFWYTRPVREREREQILIVIKYIYFYKKKRIMKFPITNDEEYFFGGGIYSTQYFFKSCYIFTFFFRFLANEKFMNIFAQIIFGKKNSVFLAVAERQRLNYTM